MEPEEPKGELKSLTIISGGNVTRLRFRQLENGDTVEEDSQTFQGLRAPRPQQQQPKRPGKAGKVRRES